MTEAAPGLCMGCMSALDADTVCPRCGYDPQSDYDHNYIKPGTVLGSRYVVGRLVHHNGEGARYIGYDQNGKSTVWVQEYFPLGMAQRSPESGEIVPQAGGGAQYKALMSDFVDICNEVKRLSITEPVVPIENVVYENNTVYAIYKDLGLTPLETWLDEQDAPILWEPALQQFMPLLNTLSNIHGHGAIHRGISPYTVHVGASGRLYLWDFALGATRTAGSELECELFSGYSAPEQYSPSGWQGTWTDVYASAALLYRMLSGVVPPRSTSVGETRPVIPLEDLVMELPPGISRAVADAMRSQTEQRTQAIATFASQLMQLEEASTAVYDTNRMPGKKPDGQNRKPPKREGGSLKYIMLALGLTVVVLVGFIAFFMTVLYPTWFPPDEGSSSQGQENPEESPENSQQSSEARTVPMFVGMRLTDIESNQDYQERFEFSVQEKFNTDFEEGLVYDQTPVSGTSMPERGTVILYVSKGPERIEIPNLTDLTLEQAIDMLFRLSPELDHEVFEQYSATVRPGRVISTVPGAGEEIDPRTGKVYLFVVPETSVVESTPSQPSASSTPSSSSRGDSSEESVWTPWYPTN